MNSVVHSRRSFPVRPVLASFLAPLLFVSCGKQQTSNSATPSSAPDSQAAATGPGPGEKVCFECNGTGTVACRAPGCRLGKVECPAPCIKLTKGVWVKRPGRSDPNETMQLITVSGKQVWVSSHHPGVTYTENASGGWDMHTCPVCNGTAWVTCPICKGKGIQTCDICKGKKFIPIAWTPTDNPWFNSQPDLIRLKDGQVILGRVAASIGEERTIITRDKKVLYVKASEILPRPDTNSPAIQTASPK
jgi:hypothetical protein